MLTITTLYASILALFFLWLSVEVIKLRRRYQIRLGDGNNAALKATIAAHANTAQYLPISLILLALLEINQAHWLLLHGFGLALLAGRLIHAQGLINDRLPLRVKGMQLTFIALAGAAISNLIFIIF